MESVNTFFGPCSVCHEELVAKECDDESTPYSLDPKAVVGHIPWDDESAGVHPAHLGCITERGICRVCDMKIGPQELRRVNFAVTPLRLTLGLSWNKIGKAYHMGEDGRAHRLLDAVEKREPDRVGDLLTYYKETGLEVACQGVQTCLSRSVELLQNDPLQAEILLVFLEILSSHFGPPSDWSVLDKAVDWSIQEGHRPLFQAILKQKYPSPQDLPPTALLSFIKAIGKSDRDRDTKDRFFAALPIHSDTRGEAILQALSEPDLDAAIRLSDGEMRLPNRLKAVRLAIPLDCIMIVERLIHGVEIETEILEKFLETALRAGAVRIVKFFLKKPGIKEHFRRELVAAHRAENKERLSLLLEAAPSELLAETMVELAGRKEAKLLNLLLSQGYLLSFPHQAEAFIRAYITRDDDSAALFLSQGSDAATEIEHIVKRAIAIGDLGLFERCLKVQPKFFPMQIAFDAALLGPNRDILSALLERHGEVFSKTQKLQEIKGAVAKRDPGLLEALLSGEWFGTFFLDDPILLKEALEIAIESERLNLFGRCLRLMRQAVPLHETFHRAILSSNRELLRALLSSHGREISATERWEEIKRAVAKKEPRLLSLLLYDGWFK